MTRTWAERKPSSIQREEQEGIMQIAFAASPRAEGQNALRDLVKRYGQAEVGAADYVVAIGGDGTALRALHATLVGETKPVFAMRLHGSIGHLSNSYSLTDLPRRLEQAVRFTLHPLQADVEHATGERRSVFSINDACLLRQTRLAAKLLITVNKVQGSTAFIGDGVLLATPIGSTAYNRSARGPLLPLGSRLLALTGIAPYRIGTWSHVALKDDAIVDVEVLAPIWRPVRLETDVEELPNIARVRMRLVRQRRLVLLFDPEVSLQERQMQRFEGSDVAHSRLPSESRGG
jgi:NAD+ kinase